jgi:hypothetical protein
MQNVQRIVSVAVFALSTAACSYSSEFKAGSSDPDAMTASNDRPGKTTKSDDKDKMSDRKAPAPAIEDKPADPKPAAQVDQDPKADAAKQGKCNNPGKHKGHDKDKAQGKAVGHDKCDKDK